MRVLYFSIRFVGTGETYAFVQVLITAGVQKNFQLLETLLTAYADYKDISTFASLNGRPLLI